MRIEYIDPEYDAVRLVDAHEAPCYDALRRTWVVHTVARMQAGLCEPRNGDEQLAPEPFADDPDYVPAQRQRNINKAIVTLRKHGPMPRYRLAEMTGIADSTITNVLSATDQIVTIDRIGNERIVGLPGQTYTPPKRYTPTAQRIADYLRAHGPQPISGLMAGLGLQEAHAGNVLRRYRDDLFAVVDHRRIKKGKKFSSIWDVIQHPEQEQT